VLNPALMIDAWYKNVLQPVLDVPAAGFILSAEDK